MCIMNDDSILRLLFIKDKVPKASMTIASKSVHTVEPSAPSNHLPDYIDVKNTTNVPFIPDIDSLDGCTPIMVCEDDSRSVSPVLLLEETDYEVIVSGEMDSQLNYISNHDRNITLRRLNLHRFDDEAMYILNFRGYVGKGYFDITIDSTEISIPFEVRSKKIDYLKDYPLMLEDISRFSIALLMSTTSPLHEMFTVGQITNDTFYEDFMLLDYIFRTRDLIGSYNIIHNNKHKELKTVSEIVPSCVSEIIDPCELTSLVASDNLLRMGGGPIAGEYMPSLVLEDHYIDSYDTPENRVVKDLIIALQNMIHRLIAYIPDDTNPYISNKLSDMCVEIDLIACDSWLRDVGNMKAVPFNSMVLQNREGYSNLFEIYQMIGLGVMFKQDDFRDLLEGQNNRMHLVYEYWCYIRLYHCLSSISDIRPEFPFEKVDGLWNLTIRTKKPTHFRATINGSNLNIDLYYNKVFNQRNDDFISYSVDLRPDYTLLITCESKPEPYYIINFDAKYKSRPIDSPEIEDINAMNNAECWSFDICKMHTYRDALLHSFGSYILYPGNRKIIYRKPLRDEDWASGLMHIIPSVGAICMTPGDDTSNELEILMRSILHAILDYSSGEYCIDPSLEYSIDQ